MGDSHASNSFRFPGGFVLYGYLLALASMALAVAWWSAGLDGSAAGALAVSALAGLAAARPRVVVGDQVHLFGMLRRRTLDRRAIVAVEVGPLIGGRFARNGVVTFHIDDGRTVRAYALVGGAAVDRGSDVLPRWLSWGRTVRELRSAVLLAPPDADS